MEKNLLNYLRTPLIICTIMILIVGVFSSFNTSSFSNENLLLENSQSQNPSFLYEGKPDRFKHQMNGSSETITFCGLESNKEYQVNINTSNGSNCKVLINNISQKGNANELVFISSTSCHEVTLINPCEQNEMDVVLTLQEVIEIDNKITDKTNDNPELPVIAVSGTTYTPEELITDVFIGGGCFDVSNVNLIGSSAGVGSFTNGASSIGFDEGIILTSGNINTVPGPNNQGGAGGDNGGPSDSDLLFSTTNSVFDAAGLEFDFQPTVNTVEFNFAFASEEYCEWVNSNFNDVFGFFISGPGFNGPFSNNGVNIGLVPGTMFPITINNINDGMNSQYFVPNSTSCSATTNLADIQFDGYTTVLTAVANVIPCETYHIRLVIGDAGDDILDSGVFLEANSFDAGGNATASAEIPATNSNVIYEDCGDGFVTFTRQSNDLSLPLVIDLNLSPASTATNGVDITLIPTTITIPPGQVEVVIPISAFQDNIVEGSETLIFEVVNSCSCINGTVEIVIEDNIPIDLNLDDESHCNSAPITLDPSATGGIPPLNYIWSNGMTTPTITEIVNTTTTYTVTVTDQCGNQMTESATVDISAMPTATLSGFAEICQPGNPVGTLNIDLTGDGPWTLFYTINGALQPPITNITSTPYSLQVTQVGTYALQIVEGNGCPGIGLGAGVVIETLVDGITAVTDASCEGQANGGIDLIPFAGMSPWTFAWSNGTTEEDLGLVTAGTYTVTLTDANGCTGSVSATIGEGASFTASAAPIANVDCNNPTGGSIDLMVNGTAPSYTFNWDNGAPPVEDPTGLAAGTYNVTITADGGCTATATAIITEDTTPPIAVANTNPPSLDCSAMSINLDGNGSSTGNVSYLWTTTNGSISSGNTTLNPTVTEPGVYELLVTNTDNGCTASTVVTVTSNVDLPTSDPGITQTIDCISSNINLDGSGSSTGSNFSYLWTTPDGNIISGNTTLNPNVNAAGTYNLLVTNTSNGCTQINSVTIGENTTPPQVVATAPNSLDCQTTSVSLNGNGSATGSSITYLWTTTSGSIASGETTLTPSVTAAGTYQLQVTDTSNGCTATATATVTADSNVPTALITPTNELNCTNMSLTLDGSSSSTGTYIWTTPDGNIVSGNTTLNPNIDQAGTYELQVTASNGCTATSSITIVENTNPPDADAGTANQIGCTTTSILLDGGNSSSGGNFSYLWTTIGGNIVSGNTTLQPTVDATGVYTLVVTDTGNGCTAESSVTVTGSMDLPTAIAGTANDLTCTVMEVTLDGTGSETGNGITYLWTTTTGNIVSGNTSLTPIVNGVGTYSLVVTDTNNGCSSTSTVTVGENTTLPTVNTGVAPTLGCSQTSVSLNGNGSSTGTGITYVWTTTNGNIVSGENTLEPVVNAAGTYELLITNTITGCTNSDNITVIADSQLPAAIATTPNDLTCLITQLTIDGNGSSTGTDITYLWTTTTGNIVSGETTLSPIINAAGTYELLVSNGTNGCTNTTTVIVNETVELPTADPGTNSLINCDFPVLTLDGSGSSTGTEFSYQWTTATGNIVSGGTTLTPEVDLAGEYILLITNTQTGCTEEASITVTGDAIEPIAFVNLADPLTCTVTTTSLNGVGSSAGTEFTYLWTTATGNIVSGETTLEPVVNAAGTYELLVTNTINGCTNIETVDVVVNGDVPDADAGPTDNLTCNITTSTLAGSGSTGQDITYLWSTATGNIVSGGTTLTPTINAPGTYELLVSNTSNGCSAISTVTITETTDLPTVDPGTISLINCDFPVLTLDGSGSSTGTEFSYQWTTATGNIVSGGTTLTPDVDLAGEYILLITNTQTGCTEEASITVTGDAIEPIAFVNLADPLTCSITTTSLNGIGSSAGTEFTYLWTTVTGNIVSGETTLEPVVNAAGTYELLVTNTINGCTNTETVDVIVNGDVPDADAGQDDLLNCNITSTSLVGTASVGTDITYLWTTMNGNIVSDETTLNPVVDQPGIYQLTVSNTANGCSAISTVEITLDDTEPTADAGVAQTLSCTNNSLQLDGSGSSLGTNYTYLWTTTNGNITSGETTLTPDVNATGIYELTVTSLDNGCTQSAEVEILQDSSLPTAIAGDPFEITCNVFGGTLDGTASSSGPDITYLWTTTNGNIVSGETTLTPDIDAPGVYQLLLSNAANGCTAISSVTIPENNTPPAADAGATLELNCFNNTLVIDGSNSSVGTGITYLWTTTNGTILSGETTLSPEISTEGIYELLVTNTTTGCFSNSEVIITENFAEPNAIIAQPMELNCNIVMTTIDATASTTGTDIIYSWTTTNGNIVSGENTLEPIVDAPGTYECFITNTTNGCTTTESIVVTQSVDFPTAEAIAIENLNCITTQTILGGGNSSVGTDFEYAWTTTNGNILMGNTTLTPTINAPGTYTLTVINTINNCETTAEVTVEEFVTPPTAIAGNQGLLTCTTTDTQLDGTGSSVGTEFTYLWTTTNGTIISGETTLAPQVGSTGIYQLEVTNTTTGCTSTSTTDVISDGNLPNAFANPLGMLTCDESTVSLTGAGSSLGNNFTYLWTTADGNIVSGSTTLDPVVDAIGTYVLLVTNTSNGCTSQVSTQVMDDVAPPSALIDLTSSLLLDCNNSSLVLDGSGSLPIGNVSYLWTTIDGNIASGATTPNPEIDDAGTYNLLVTNLTNGCTSETQVTVTQDVAVPQLTIATPQVLTCDLTQIDLSATTSAGTFSYQWTTANGNIISGATTLQPTISQPGTYQLIITDQINNCENSTSVTVTENTTSPDAEAGTADMLDCQTTSITLNGNGSSFGNNITYEWTTTNGNIVGTNTTLSPTVNSPGNYNLVVTDLTNGCTAVDFVTVDQDASSPSDIIFTMDNPECTGDGGSINIETVVGGTPPYLYSIDGVNFYNGHIFTTTPGDYILYAQDANGCELETSFTIPELPPVTVDLIPEASIVLGNDYDIQALTNIPINEIESISWSPTANLSCTDCLNPTVEQLYVDATYTITVTNIYGCKATATIDIEVDRNRAIYVPNVFTPNGDTNNDIFTIYVGAEAQIKKIKYFHVFDRWGELVHSVTSFEPNNPSHGWDGTLRGEKLNPAVFVYWFEVEFIDGETRLFKGDVALRK